MHSRCLLQLLLFLSSLILPKAQDVMGSGLSCVRSSPADDGQTRVTFLREDPAGARSLYLTLWSEDIKLLTCKVNHSPLVTGNYLSLCGRGDTQEEELSRRFNISALVAPESPCARGTSGAKFSKRARGDRTSVKSRQRRGVTFPGTLWCGTGSTAVGYDELGMFESADRCCREHDHCEHNIPAFTMNYGVFNSKFYTVSHCDCDQRFRQCLLTVNDTISSMVGYSFFNMIQVPCFELKPLKRCTQMYWWGMCKAASVAPYAVFKSPLPYNSSDPANKHADITDREKVTRMGEKQATKSPVISTKSPKSDQRCSNAPRGDTFQHRGKKGKGCRRHQRGSTVAPSTTSASTKVNITTLEMKTHLSKSSTLVSNQKRDRRKKSNKQRLSANTDRVTTNVFSQTTSTTQRTPSSTQTPAFQTHAQTAATKTTKSWKKSQKPRLCCGLMTPLRGDAFQPRCKKCAKHNTTSRTTTATPSETTSRLPENQQLTKMTEEAKEDTSRRLRSRGPSSKTNIPADAESETQKTKKSHLKNTNQESMNQTKALNTPAERGLTDRHLLCASLKHLDDCRYKIAPQEKKFDLQNTETKTAYQCNCTSRLALQIKTFSQPGVLLSLLKDFVSVDCFKLPATKKCHSQKSCSGGFTKASDLLQALKKIEGRDTSWVQNSVSDRKRGIPVRLWKRCLRLQREADIMAQLTRL